MQPKTESHVVLDFVDAAGTGHSEIVVGYLERLLWSAETVVPTGNKVQARENVDILFCKGSWLDFIR